MSSYKQNEELEIKIQKPRFYALIVLTGISFSILFFRLVYLQIYHGKEFRHYSDSNRFNKQFLRAPRGFIFDKNKRILVGNKNVVQLKLNLNIISNLEEVLKKISPIINIPLEEIKKKVEKRKRKYEHYHPITIKSSLNLNEIHQLKLLHWNYPGIYVEETQIRMYPLKENGFQIFGYVGEISKENRMQFKKEKISIHPLDLIGKRGIEKFYDSHLRGVHGWNFVEVDALNRMSPQTISPPSFLNNQPIQGENITLTIDKKLQQFTLKAMNRRDSIGYRNGSVIVMKTNGEILSWVSLPSFDSNIFSTELDERVWKQLLENNPKSFINKGLQEHYSPGSTFKPFVAIAALSEGLIHEDTLLNSPNQLRFGNRIFHGHSRMNHGRIDIVTAIEKSANTFFYQLGKELGIKKMETYARLFGFGQKTNIKLEGESQGLFPNPLWKRKQVQKSWALGDTINISIGQGSLLVTLLQLTVAYNVIATEGLLVKPFLVKQVDDKIIEHTIVDTLTDRIDRNHFITIKQGLKQVVEGLNGTARYWKIPNLSYGGKTGTAQVFSIASQDIYKKCRDLPKKLRHNGLFVALAPIQKPEIIVSVLTENSCSGSFGSAPIAKDIIQYYMKNYKKDST